VYLSNKKCPAIIISLAQGRVLWLKFESKMSNNHMSESQSLRRNADGMTTLVTCISLILLHLTYIYKVSININDIYK